MASLKGLPNELKLIITGHLNQMDQQCLRLTSRQFFKLIPHESLEKAFYFLLPSEILAIRLQLLSRLFEPGNAFSSSEYEICGTCANARPQSSDFPMSALRIVGYRVCENCLLMFVQSSMPFDNRGSYEYDGIKYRKCACCRRVNKEVEMCNVIEHNYSRLRRVLVDYSMSDFRGLKLCRVCHDNNYPNEDCEWSPVEDH